MEEEPKIVSKINILKMIVFLIIAIFVVFILAGYLINDEFRNDIDTKILKKEVSENTAGIIEVNSDSNPKIYAFDKYITVLNKNVLNLYDGQANLVTSMDVNVANPCMASNGKHLVVAENGGNKLYFISELLVKWEKDLEGEIYQVSVNENGYISVILKNSIYKSIVVVYDNEGNELFKTYLKKNYAICSEISNRNKYLAIGQIDYSGTVVKSVVRLISIETVEGKLQTSEVNKYASESGKILNNIKFNDKQEAICMFDSYVQKVTESTIEKLYEVNEGDIFVDVNLENNILVVEKETSGLFSYQYQMSMKNTVGKSDNLYILENDVPQKLKVNKNLICLHLTGEVRVVNGSGWFLKRYTTSSEIQDIVLGESIMGIVYKNKIEVIDL